MMKSIKLHFYILFFTVICTEICLANISLKPNNRDSVLYYLKKSKLLENENKAMIGEKLSYYAYQYLRTKDSAENYEEKIDIINMILYENSYAFHQLRGLIIFDILGDRKSIIQYNYFLTISSFCCYDDSLIMPIMRNLDSTYAIKKNELSLDYYNYLISLMRIYKLSPTSKDNFYDYRRILYVAFPESKLFRKYSLI